MSQGQRRLAAVMFTDMVGYSALTQSNEAQAMEVLGRHNALLRPFFPRFHGREVKTIGDSFLVEFENALDAVKCAVEVQSFLHDYNISTRGEWKITLRIGIHLGDVIHDRTDVLGDAVNIASRIQPLAAPEGVCVSSEVYDQVHNKLEQDLVSLGERALKNIAAPVQVYKVEMPWEETAAPATLDRRRVAVLPFVSISPDPNDEYFADGLTEELIGRLSLVRGLEVIARTSAMNYKREKKNASQIGRELKVGTLLEGSVRKAGDRIRVTAQLIDANSEGHLWMENYDRRLDDVFVVQSEVAEKVAGSLQLKLTVEDKKQMQNGGTLNAEAHALYLKGLFYLHRWDKDSLSAAIKLFQDALALDGDYALAYCGLAGAHNKLGFQDLMEAKEAHSRVREYGEKAMALAPSLAESHFHLSMALENTYDFEGRIRELQKAVELDPNYADAYGGMAAVYSYMGRTDDCIRCIKKVLELDPLSVESAGSAGTWYLYAKQYDEAIKHLRNAIELDPANSFYLDNLGLAYVQKGMIEEGLAMVKKAVEISKTPGMCSDLGYALVKAGRPEEARALLNELLERRTGQVTPSSAIAGLYAVLGDKDNAILWLERAFEQRSGYLAATGEDFVFENVHDDERYLALLRKMGLRPSQ